MATRMLIDATHEEETRVVVVKGNQVEEFDFETANRKALKGNIYLARVTRVEPSLQAAFVDFGGNRHGFLAFSEIHPDYYQIPVADRERLKREEAAAAAADDDDEDEEEEEEEQADTGGRRTGESDESDDEPHFDGDARDAADSAAAGSAAGDEQAGPAEGEDPAAGADRPGADIGEPPAYGNATPSSALPERSGLRRVARLFGFGAEGNGDRGSEAAGGVSTPAFMSQDPQQQSDDNAAGEWEPAATGLAEGTDEQDAPSDHDEDAAAQQATPSGEAEAPPAQRSSEVDDEDRPAEERDDSVEAFGGDAVDEVRRRSSKRRPLTRRYKIQEVIKRRQILLVQVVKEERGNKGAALTTYLSLAGRYCVLMPNSPNGGGISRKIVSALDRKRLKAITGELDVPDGMGMIVRTAGMERNRAEIKRDFEFLLRSWDNIRELTLASMAPCLVYEEANLIKRAIRDLYNKDIDEILVEGDNGYRHAKDFMKMLMPSHSKRVQPYKDRIPLFHRYQTEAQLDEMFFPTVQLRSGGYIVINATEALVAIDVNSGRSTKEHSIESTAYKTNMEAAEEVARQLRLRDMAGLIVIDFIDMDESRNARNVERKLKECLKLDRARIQVGRISSFGLLEMSRQRLRPSLVEQSMVTCPHCDGQGHVRSVESATIRAIRAAEDEGIRERSAEVTLIVPTKVAIYLLNSKRDVLQEIEGRYGMRVLVKNDDTLGPSEFNLERSKTRSDGEPPVQRVITAESTPYREADDTGDDESDAEEAFDDEAETEDQAEPVAAPERAAAEDDEEQKGGRGKRRRRRRRRGGDDNAESGQDSGHQAAAEGDEQDGDEPARQETRAADPADAEDGDAEDDGDDENRQEAAAGDEDGDAARRGRRRGRRGGRRRRRRQDRDESGEQPDLAAGEQQTGEDGGQPAPAADDGSEDDRQPVSAEFSRATGSLGEDDSVAELEPAGELVFGQTTESAVMANPAAEEPAAGDGRFAAAEEPAAEQEDRPLSPDLQVAAGTPDPVEAVAASAPMPEPETSVAPQPEEEPEPVLGDGDAAAQLPADEDAAPAEAAAAPEEGAGAPEAAEPPAATAEAEAEAPPPAPIPEPESGAVLKPEDYAPAGTAEGGSEAPRRGWWRRAPRQDGDQASGQS